MSRPQTAMVVASDQTQREFLRQVLSSSGLAVQDMASSDAVVDAQMKVDPAVVVVDCKSPEMDPISLVEALGKCPVPPPVVVVGLRADATPRASDSHFVEYVGNDDAPGLLQAMKRALEFRRLQLSYRESQSRLIRSERLATLGSMLAGLAHEIRTPLGAISGNNDVLEMAAEKVRERFQGLVAEHPNLRSECESISEVLEDTARTNRMASERLLAIVRGARNLARTDTAREATDIHEGIESSLILLAHELKGRIEVVREFGALPTCECCPGEINQVLLNLLLNAAQAIEDRGTIRIRTWTENDAIRVSISDDGVGIPEDIRERVFEEGFTTKSSGLGSGLGLSISKSIVQNHGGRIEVESSSGSGTTFTITLPRTFDSE